ncbi:hypothetical protein Hanom_Chr05g00404781 [Helianthus anomalus]
MLSFPGGDEKCVGTINFIVVYSCIILFTAVSIIYIKTKHFGATWHNFNILIDTWHLLKPSFFGLGGKNFSLYLTQRLLLPSTVRFIIWLLTYAWCILSLSHYLKIYQTAIPLLRNPNRQFIAS